MAIDISRLSEGVSQLLPPEISTEIWGVAQEESAVMRLARPYTVPGRGLTIPVITGDAQADWVGETDHKKVSNANMGVRQLTPYKMAVIEIFSKQFLRDVPALYEELARRLPSAIAKKFDSTVFGTTAPGSNFATLGAATAVKIGPHATNVKEGTWAGLVEAVGTVAAADGQLNGWAFSPQGKSLLLKQVDTTGRPLLAGSVGESATVPSLVGEPVLYTKGVYTAGTPNTIGFAGDWDSAIWGMVNGIEVSQSTEATIENGTISVTTSGDETVEIPNFVSLFGRNMFALLCEVEIGFQVHDISRFVKLTDATRT
ncbi:MAG: phage major capsid protein [Propionibacteriaceae bacterium]|jgi:HK97 family phage major capsid protein|nr:phage major capsid protein [Propionibacteriaceae bacterium]